MEAAIKKKLHCDFDTHEHEDDIDDGIESIHDEDESILREDKEEPENKEEPEAQEEPEDNETPCIC